MSGIKHDKGKSPITLIPSEVIVAMADVLEMGREKYGALNWVKGISYTRLMDAAYRHQLKFQSGIDNDDESNESHLIHAMVNLMFLYYFTQHKPELDDRWEGK